MKLAGTTATHLGYCTNIHPGESWGEVKRNLERYTLAVKQRVSPERPFGVGLRLSAAAAATLSEPGELESFARFLLDRGLYVFTINGFPYGPFHGQPVKEQVYRPDWMEEERLVYTDQLAHILAALLPREFGPIEGSISTVPGCFRGRAASDAHAFELMAERLLRQVATLVGIAERGGPCIGLALEPEPHCVFETTAELLAFFSQHLFCERGVARLAEQAGTNRGRAAELLRRHLGMCLDACHAAVEFESPAEIVEQLDRSGVRVLKLQVTTGLRISSPAAEALALLDRFAEGTYLHQTVIRRGRALVRHLDLPEALAAARAAATGLAEEWRVHFHVPVFQRDLAALHPGFENTHAFLTELLRIQARDPLTAHLEVETYTWDVLPPELRDLAVEDAIARELEWTRAALTPST